VSLNPFGPNEVAKNLVGAAEEVAGLNVGL